MFPGESSNHFENTWLCRIFWIIIGFDHEVHMTASTAHDVSFTSTSVLSDDDAALLGWLRDRDVECPLCQYNLRGLTVPRCPECGHALCLSVSLIDPFAKAWVALAVAVCGSAGFGLMLLCLVLRAGLPHEGIADWMIIFFILTMPLPLVLLKTRRRFQQLSRSRQWFVAIAICALPAVAMAILCFGLG
jgi:hypothetical protein